MFRYVLLASALGAVTSITVVGAILLATYNLPEPTPDVSLTTLAVERVVVLVAALLATAPLIEWWYNHLSSWLRVPLRGAGIGYEGQN